MTADTRVSRLTVALGDLSIFLLILLLLAFLRPDIVYPLIYLLLYPYILLSGRRHLLPQLLLASACSLVWMLLGGGIYGYRDIYYSIGFISIYPLAAWAVGFFLAYVIATAHPGWHRNVLSRALLYTATYWFILILYETVAYHVFEIRNPTTLGYPGLPLCDCIHAPVWVQITYLAMGPIYFLLCELFGLNRRI